MSASNSGAAKATFEISKGSRSSCSPSPLESTRLWRRRLSVVLSACSGTARRWQDRDLRVTGIAMEDIAAAATADRTALSTSYGTSLPW